MKPAPWRTGRKLGRTLYERKYTDGPSDEDRFLGLVDTPELARRIVEAVNEREDLLADLDHAERENRRLQAELAKLKR